MASLQAKGELRFSFENLEGIDGRSYSLSSFDDKQILVLVFLGNGCPTCKATEERLIALQKDYRTRGVQVIAINPNSSSISPPDTLEEMRKRASEVGYNFTYLKDKERRLARSLGAQTTPHAFVLDKERRVRYQGRFDNARQKSLVTVSDVRSCLEEILAGMQVTVSQTNSFGCTIVW